MKLLFIDTETSGLNPKTNGLLQISAVLQIDGEVVDRFSSYVKPFPKDYIDEKALATNKITREQIETFPEPQKVYVDFISFLGKYASRDAYEDKYYMVGYNVWFDYDMLREWFHKAGDTKYFGYWFQYPPIDVMQLALLDLGESVRSKMAKFKLEAVADMYGLEFKREDLHGADVDCELTKQLFNIIYPKYYEKIATPTH